MSEKRKYKRLDLESELVIKKIDGNVGHEQKARISIKDVSKTGLGFTCDYQLDVGSVYECYLTIWTKETLHCFVEVVRMSNNNGTYNYGAIFVGMSDMDQKRIEIYETFEGAGLA